LGYRKGQGIGTERYRENWKQVVRKRISDGPRANCALRSSQVWTSSEAMVRAAVIWERACKSRRIFSRPTIWGLVEVE
jgi:hypothetical protein